MLWWTTGTRSSLMWFGGWVWSGFAKHWALLGMLVLAGLVGAVVEANISSAIAACPSPKSPCYLLRWDKSKVVLPSQPKSAKP